MRGCLGAFLPLLLLLSVPARAEEMAPIKPGGTEAPSSLRYFTEDQQQGVETINRAYELTDDHAPGHPGDSGRIVLKSEIRTKELIGDEGVDGHVAIDAWLIGADFSTKPLYSIAVEGSSFRHLDNQLIVERGTGGDSDWQSVYRTGTGRHLFDVAGAAVPFRIREDASRWGPRIAGLYLIPDDESDPDLKGKEIVGLLGYTATEAEPGTVHQLLLTCDDAQEAVALRAFWSGEEQWNIAVDPVFGDGSGAALAAKLTLTLFGEAKARIVIPIVQDDFDLEHAALPAGLHLARWKP